MSHLIAEVTNRKATMEQRIAQSFGSNTGQPITLQSDALQKAVEEQNLLVFSTEGVRQLASDIEKAERFGELGGVKVGESEIEKAKKDLAKLVKVQKIDKNGKKTTVYVSRQQAEDHLINHHNKERMLLESRAQKMKSGSSKAEEMLRLVNSHETEYHDLKKRLGENKEIVDSSSEKTPQIKTGNYTSKKLLQAIKKFPSDHEFELDSDFMTQEDFVEFLSDEDNADLQFSVDSDGAIRGLDEDGNAQGGDATPPAKPKQEEPKKDGKYQKTGQRETSHTTSDGTTFNQGDKVTFTGTGGKEMTGEFRHINKNIHSPQGYAVIRGEDGKLYERSVGKIKTSGEDSSKKVADQTSQKTVPKFKLEVLEESYGKFSSKNKKKTYKVNGVVIAVSKKYSELFQSPKSNIRDTMKTAYSFSWDKNGLRTILNNPELQIGRETRFRDLYPDTTWGDVGGHYDRKQILELLMEHAK